MSVPLLADSCLLISLYQIPEVPKWIFENRRPAILCLDRLSVNLQTLLLNTIHHLLDVTGFKNKIYRSCFELELGDRGLFFGIDNLQVKAITACFSHSQEAISGDGDLIRLYREVKSPAKKLDSLLCIGNEIDGVGDGHLFLFGYSLISATPDSLPTSNTSAGLLAKSPCVTTPVSALILSSMAQGSVMLRPCTSRMILPLSVTNPSR